MGNKSLPLKRTFRYNESVTKLPFTDKLPFEITHFGVTHSDSEYHQIRLSSKYTAVEYVLSGSGILNVDGHSYIAQKGDTYILPQGKDQNYYSIPNDPMEKIWFNCTGPLATVLLEQYGLDDMVIFRNTHSCHYIEKMHSIFSSDNTSEHVYENFDKAALLYHEILQFLVKNKCNVSLESSPIDSIRYYIDNHISENIKLADIAKFSSYTPDHIIRLFKERYNITPHQYIINSKMQIAEALLTQTSKSINEISAELNFSEVHHFSKLFEKTVGLRPSAYRKQSKLQKI